MKDKDGLIKYSTSHLIDRFGTEGFYLFALIQYKRLLHKQNESVVFETELIDWLGVERKRSLDSRYEILKKMQEDGMYKMTHLYKDAIHFSDLDSDLFNPVNDFTMIPLDQFELILNIKTKAKKGLLFSLYVVIKYYLSISNINTGVAYPSYEKLMYHIPIAKTTITRTLDELKDNKLIYYTSGGYRSGGYHNSNVYCEWSKEADEKIQWFNMQREKLNNTKHKHKRRRATK